MLDLPPARKAAGIPYGLYANAHRWKIRKAGLATFPLWIVDEQLRPIPSTGWTEMIPKVYDVDPMVCLRCGGQMKVIAFFTDQAVVGRIIDHLKLTIFADKPPPPQFAYPELLAAAKTLVNIFRDSLLCREERSVGFPQLL